MAGGVRGRFQGAGGSFLRGLGKISRSNSHLQGFDFHNFPWHFYSVCPHSGDTVGTEDYFFIPAYQRGFLVGFSLKIRNFASINRDLL